MPAYSPFPIEIDDNTRPEALDEPIGYWPSAEPAVTVPREEELHGEDD